MSKKYITNVSQFNANIEDHFERNRHLRDHSCPMGCHQQSHYPPDQYHEYECHHQKLEAKRVRDAKWIVWAQEYVKTDISSQERRYFEQQIKLRLLDMERDLKEAVEEFNMRKKRAREMPHIYNN